MTDTSPATAAATTARWNQIAPELAYVNGSFPLAAVLEARDFWPEVRSHFLAALTRAIADPQETVAAQNALPVYAMYLAAEKRDTAFAPALLDLLSLHPDDIDELLGETTLAEGVGRCLGAVWQGDERPIWDVARDTQRDGYVRLAAIDALVVRVMEGELDIDPVVAGIFEITCQAADQLLARRATRGKSRPDADESGPFSFFNLLVLMLADLGATAHWPQIEAWQRDGLIDVQLESPAVLRETMFASAESRRARMFKPDYVRDAVEEMSGWACFNEPVPYVREQPKVGRNDPCPCGSGRKFKKCCGTDL